MGTVWTIVVAAGSGSRFGGAKQYADLGGRRVVDWAIADARVHSDGVVLVVPSDRASTAEPEVDTVVVGGASRSASVRAGLAAIPPDAELVLVHDAARPMAGADLFASVVTALRDGADAVVPGVAVVDTIRHRSGGVLDRDDLVAVQTPQGFRAEALRTAHAAGGEATDDAALVEALGMKVVVVEGHPGNRKITDAVDLAVADRLVR
jgi:2-C-methyl-D-erythritol 4-phosphate cytidylyltransferase